MANMLSTIFERLSFRTDYKTKDELKKVTVYFLVTTIFLLAVAVLSNNSVVFSSTVFTGCFLHFLAFLYFLQKLTEMHFKAKEKIHRTLVKVFYALCFSFVLITLIYLAESPAVPAAENRQVSLIAAMLLIVLPVSFSDEIIGYFKNKFSIILAIPFLPSNVTMSFDTSELISQFFRNNTPIGFIQDLFAQWLPGQASAWVILTILSVAFFALKFITNILKFIIILFVLWVGLQFFGVI
jgi:hypothetical protein